MIKRRKKMIKRNIINKDVEKKKKMIKRNIINKDVEEGDPPTTITL